jgi:hypothetical protein
MREHCKQTLNSYFKYNKSPFAVLQVMSACFMKAQNQDPVYTAWCLCCSDNLAGGQFLHQPCA